MDIKPISNLPTIDSDISQLSANDKIYFEVSKLDLDDTTYKSYKVQSSAMLKPLFAAIARCFEEIENIKKDYVLRSEFETLLNKVLDILDGKSTLNDLYVTLHGEDTITGNKIFMNDTTFHGKTTLDNVECDSITANSNCEVNGILNATECNIQELTCTDALVNALLVALNEVALLTAAAAYWS